MRYKPIKNFPNNRNIIAQNIEKNPDNINTFINYIIIIHF